MTETQTRRQPGAAGVQDRQPSIVLAALAAAGWAVGIGLIAVTVVVLVAWTSDTRSGSSASAALRTAARIWLLAHGGRIRLPVGHFGLVPLGLTVLIGAVLRRSGASLARAVGVRGPAEAARAVASMALGYAVLAVVVTGPAAGGGVSAARLPAFVGAGLLAAAAGGLGVLGESGLSGVAWRALPGRVRAAVHGGAVAAATVLVGAAFMVAGSLVLHAGRTEDLFRALGAGAVGSVVLLVISVGYAPNALACGAAYLVGPGFAVGTGTVVSLTSVRLGPVPAVPLLGVLPQEPTGRAALALLLVPVAGGLLAGVVAGRYAADGGPLKDTLLAAAGCGPVAGAAVGVLAAVAGGPAGPGRLATVGASAALVAPALAVEVALPAVAAAWWTVRRR